MRTEIESREGTKRNDIENRMRLKSAHPVAVSYEMGGTEMVSPDMSVIEGEGMEEDGRNTLCDDVK